MNAGAAGAPGQWRVLVDSAACNGTGLCVGTAADHFELGADHTARPRSAVVPPDGLLLAAAECCPMEAIRVVDAATGEPVALG